MPTVLYIRVEGMVELDAETATEPEGDATPQITEYLIDADDAHAVYSLYLRGALPVVVHGLHIFERFAGEAGGQLKIAAGRGPHAQIRNV